jgi:linoleoyl-CoA desaturase
VGDPQHIDNEWAIHQVETTADFAQQSWLLTHYLGGLNYQVEHHLFPHINHMNYPRIAPIVRVVCQEFGVRYNAFPNWGEAFAGHIRQLRALGHAPVPAERAAANQPAQMHVK